MIQACQPCRPHPYQDQRYGKNQRVHTPFKTKAGVAMARCTVCMAEKTAATKEAK